jgi:hypothetical protein
MAIVRLLNEALLEVRENGEEVADKIRRERRVIRLTDRHDPSETSVWVNVTAITSFVEGEPPEPPGPLSVERSDV